MAGPQSAGIHTKGGAQQTLATFWRCRGSAVAFKRFQCGCDPEEKTMLKRVNFEAIVNMIKVTTHRSSKWSDIRTGV
jgi:hypothetical protein